MISHLKSFITSSALYTLAVGIEALVPFALLPILTRLLTPSDYGVWIIFVALYSFIRPLVTLNLQDAIRSHFLQLSESGVHGLVVGALLLSTAMTVAVGILFGIFNAEIASLIHFPESWIWAAPVTAYVYGVFYLFLAVFQFRGDVRNFIRFQLLQAGMGLLFVLLFLSSGMDWRGAVLGRIAGVTVTALIAWPLIARGLRLVINREIAWRKLLLFGFRYLPVGLGVVVIPLTNRLFVAHYAGIEQAGFLGIASLFGSALGLVTTGYLFAWQPRLFRALQGESSNAERSEVKAFFLLFSLLFPAVGVALIIASKLALPLLVPPQYLSAIPLIGISIWGGVAQAYFEQSQTVLLGERREGEMSLVYLLVMSLNVLLNMHWVQSHGCEGALQATCVSFLVGTAISSLFAFPSARRALSSCTTSCD